MTCPFCGAEADRRALHGHLVATHGDAVEVGRDESQARLSYRLACPRCEFVVTQTVRPRSTDTGFLEEFRREIGLVAFDLLLYHLDGVHGEQETEATGASALIHIPLLQE